jgi:UDP-glucose 4-epimerase
METVLVTGGAGFLGSHVADALLERGYRVAVLDDLSGGFKENVPDGAKFVQGSVTDAKFVNALFSYIHFDHVFHFAAYAAEGLSHFIKKFNYENNLIGSVNLINASVNTGVKTFVFASSIAVYGAGPLPMVETQVPKPEDSYGISKLAVEMELRASQKMFGLDYVIFRLCNVYGPRQNIGDKYRNVVGIFMNQILQGQPMTIFGDGLQRRAFTYVGDVSPIIAESIENPHAKNEIFNMGADHHLNVYELAYFISQAMGTEVDIKFLDARNEVHTAYLDNSKAKNLLGFNAITPLTVGILKTAAWVKKHGARKSAEFQNIEIRKNLPLSWATEESLRIAK